MALLEEGVGEEEDEENAKPGTACLVKLIDLAHTNVVAGEGPKGRAVGNGMEEVNVVRCQKQHAAPARHIWGLSLS